MLNRPFKNNAFNRVLDLLAGLRRTKKFNETVSIKEDSTRYANWLAFFNRETINDFLLPQVFNNTKNPFDYYKECFDQCQSKNLLDKVMYSDQKILLPDCYLEKVDKASMAVGLETRSPILNHHLVEFANSIPEKYKIKGLKTKYIFKEAMKDFLPEEILNKQKHGLSVPTNIWFRGKLRSYLFEIIFDAKTRSRGYFDFSYIEKLYKSYQNNNQPFDSQLWLILNFELWYRQFMDKSSKL
jgi:asparagine synthase (glutamine-hydrolysing)